MKEPSKRKTRQATSNIANSSASKSVCSKQRWQQAARAQDNTMPYLVLGFGSGSWGMCRSTWLESRNHSTIHSTIHSTMNSTISCTMNGTMNGTIYGTRHGTIYSTIYGTRYDTIHGTINGARHGTSDEAIHYKMQYTTRCMA